MQEFFNTGLYKIFEPKYKDIIGKPFITVSAKGISNGLSNIPNDGADFGPDTTLNATSPSQTGPPYSSTLGINEAINYAGNLATSSRQYNVQAAIPVYLNAGLYFLQDEISMGTAPYISLVSLARRGAILIGAPGKNIINVSSNNEISLFGVYLFSGSVIDINNPSLSAIVFNTDGETTQTTITMFECNFQYPFANGTFNINTVSQVHIIDTTVDTGGGNMGYITGGTGISEFAFIGGQIAGGYLQLNTFNSINITDTFIQGSGIPDTTYNQNGGISVSKCNTVKVDGFSVSNTPAPGTAFIKIINGLTDTIVVKNGYQNNGNVTGQPLIVFDTPSGGTAGYANSIVVDNIVFYEGTGYVLYSNNGATTPYLKYNNISGQNSFTLLPFNQSIPSITPAVPASGTALQNTNPFAVNVYLYNGTVTEIQITRNGTAYTVFSNASGLALSGQVYKLNPTDSITITYTSAPTWEWLSD